jgi:hypothetical protein
LALAQILQAKGCDVRLHDPYVKPHDQNLVAAGLAGRFTQDLDAALLGARVAFVCVGHREYLADAFRQALARATSLRGVVDGANAFPGPALGELCVPAAGIGRGRRAPDEGRVDDALARFREMEAAVAREVAGLIGRYNAEYADGSFNEASYAEVRRIAGTCVTGCVLAPLDVVAEAL